MDFKYASRLGSCLAKDYAEDMFALLATYESISASEASSRLNLHVKTAQDFLEELYSLGIADREEVYEGKRPYNRYKLKTSKVQLDLDLSYLSSVSGSEEKRLMTRIRETQNAKARFITSRSNDYISSVVIWTGEGRNREERRINLSIPQGRFLFHLPFPTASPATVSDIIQRAAIDGSNNPEILDIVDLLVGFGVIDSVSEND